MKDVERDIVELVRDPAEGKQGRADSGLPLAT